jgi:hypothetical protein
MSKRHIGILAILVAGVLLIVCAGAPMAVDQPAPQTTPATQPAPQIAVYFSPRGGCTDAIVKELDAAKESVLVQAYEFTSAPTALTAAVWRLQYQAREVAVLGGAGI